MINACNEKFIAYYRNQWHIKCVTGFYNKNVIAHIFLLFNIKYFTRIKIQSQYRNNSQLILDKNLFCLLFLFIIGFLSNFDIYHIKGKYNPG